MIPEHEIDRMLRWAKCWRLRAFERFRGKGAAACLDRAAHWEREAARWECELLIEDRLDCWWDVGGAGMSTRKTVRPSEIGVGYYVAFGSDLGTVAFFSVKEYDDYGLVIWGLSRWRGRIAYRTLGIALAEWLLRQERGVQYRKDCDRTDWRGTNPNQ